MKPQYPTAFHPNRFAIPGLLVGAFLISFSGVWVKLSHVSPMSAAFYRVLIGSAFLLIGAVWRREFRRLAPHQIVLVLFAGLIFAADLTLFHTSIHYVGPGLGTILPNFQVFVMALVGALFFKEKLRWIYLVSIPLAVAGLFLVVGIHWEQLDVQYRLGVYAGLGSSLCYSCFLLSMRKLQKDVSGLSFFYILLLVSLATTGVLAVEMLRRGESFAIPDTQTLLSLTTLGLFSQCVAWILISSALPQLRVSLSGLILLLQPALSFIWDVAFFDRPTGILNWIGVAVVLGAIYLGNIGVKHGNKPLGKGIQ
jgi:drug/metabolite transporter (DMT)-like permease